MSVCVIELRGTHRHITCSIVDTQAHSQAFERPTRSRIAMLRFILV